MRTPSEHSGWTAAILALLLCLGASTFNIDFSL